MVTGVQRQREASCLEREWPIDAGSGSVHQEDIRIALAGPGEAEVELSSVTGSLGCRPGPWSGVTDQSRTVPPATRRTACTAIRTVMSRPSAEVQIASPTTGRSGLATCADSTGVTGRSGGTVVSRVLRMIKEARLGSVVCAPGYEAPKARSATRFARRRTGRSLVRIPRRARRARSMHRCYDGAAPDRLLKCWA